MNRYSFILFYFALFPFYQYVPIWSWLLALGISVHAFFVNRGRLKILNKYVMGCLAVLAGAIVYYKFKTLLGPEPATALVIILCALKLEEIRSNRDAVIFNLLIVLLVMYYLLQSQTLLATVYMLIMVLLVIFGLIKVHTPHERFRQIILSSPKSMFKDLLICVPFFLLIFVFFPRFNAPWSSLFAKEKQQVGFSEKLKPGELANLALSEEPAFRVRFTDKAPPPRLMYWRGLVLDKTDGWAWNVESKLLNTKYPMQEKKTPDIHPSELYSYNLRLEPRFNKNVFTLGNTQKLKLVNPGYNNIYESQGFVFQAKSNAIGLSEFNIESLVKWPLIENLTSVRLVELTQVPPQGESLESFITDLKKNTKNALSFSDALLEYFRDNNFSYTLETPEIPTLENFIFQQKYGFCEHYASAFASIVRLAGYPSRVVIGFQGGDYNRIADFYLIKDRHAHAWAEVYHEGAWYTYDATTVLNANRLMTGTLDNSSDEFKRSSFKALFGNIAMYYSALEMQYSTWLTEYNLETQTELFNLKNKENWIRYFIYFCLGAVGLTIFFYFFSIYLSRSQEDPILMMWPKAKEMLMRKGYSFSADTTPSSAFEIIRDKFPHNKAEFDRIIKNWLLLRYGSEEKTPNLKTIKKTNLGIEQLINQLPKQPEI
jgi:transglutaminase-like putative cysteine protease